MKNTGSLFRIQTVVRMFLLISLLMSSSAVDAKKREAEPFPVRTPFSNWSAGVSVSTMGIGLSAATPVHRSVMLRAEYSLLLLRPQVAVEMNVAALPGNRSFEISPSDITAKLESHTLRLLVDWDPIRKGAGLFWLTGGIFFQNRGILNYSEAYDADVFADFGYSGQDLRKIEIINDYGRYNLDPDATVSSTLYRPCFGMYFGLRFGRPIPNRRVGFSGEIGIPVYMGKVQGVSSNVLEYYAPSLLSPVLNQFETGFRVSAGFFLSLQLTFRLKND